MAPSAWGRSALRNCEVVTKQSSTAQTARSFVARPSPVMADQGCAVVGVELLSSGRLVPGVSPVAGSPTVRNWRISPMRLVAQRGDAGMALAGVQAQADVGDAFGGRPEQLGGVVAVQFPGEQQGRGAGRPRLWWCRG